MRNIALALAVLGIPLLADGCRGQGAGNSSSGDPGDRGFYGNATWEEVRWVIWTEFFECDEAAVSYLSGTEGLLDGDIFTLLFIANWAHVPVREAVEVYRKEAYEKLQRVAIYYSMPDEVLHVDVPNGTPCPGPYKNAYKLYWERARKPRYKLTNDEVRVLIELHIACNYYGFTAEEYFEQFEEAEKKIKRPFRSIAGRRADLAGRGGKDWRGRPLPKKVERPWETREEEKPDGHNDR